MKYTKDLLLPLVMRSTSIAAVLRLLGLRATGSSHHYISSLVRRYEIDTSHFVRGNCNPSPAKISAAQQLSRRKKLTSYVLRRSLLEIGRSEKCELCGLGTYWNDKPLRLQVDHIDGDNYNNISTNLRFLCPNCHSQTPTFAKTKNNRVKRTCKSCGAALWKWNASGLCIKCCSYRRCDMSNLRKSKKLKKNICISCGKPATNKYCSYECSHNATERIKWPENLSELVSKSSKAAVARQLGVSDVAVGLKLRRLSSRS